MKKPPKIAKYLLSLLLSDRELYRLGDFEEIFQHIAENESRIKAYRWYWLHTIRSIPELIKNKIYWSMAMFKNYLKIALRNMNKNKSYSMINIFGLTLGMACCILIMLWIQDELSFEDFHKKADRIARVVSKINFDSGEILRSTRSIPPLANALKEDYPEIEDAVRFFRIGRSTIKVNDKLYYEDMILFSDPNVFNVFTLPLKSGDPNTALKDLSSVIISEEIAEKYFGDRNPIGETIVFREDYSLKVTGVLKEIPKNTHIRAKFLINYSFIKNFGYDISNDRWDDYIYFTYILLKDESTFTNLDEKIRDFLKRKRDATNIDLHLQPLKSIHLHSNYVFDLTPPGNIEYVYIFSVIAIFILLIACINFINLTTARSVKRFKEIGIRKVVGANRKNLVWQFLGESFITSIISIAISVVIVILVLPNFNFLSGKEIDADILYQPKTFFILLFIALIAGVMSGSYSAVYLSSFQPVQIMRGNILKGGFGNNPVILRRVLVVVQFTLSIFLIISTLTIYEQIDYIQNKKLGYNKENIVYFRNRGNTARLYDTIKNELLKIKNVENVTSASNLPTYAPSSTSGIDWEGRNTDDNLQVYRLDVRYDFIETFKMKISEGKSFSKLISEEKLKSYILNEKGINSLGIEDPVGKRFSLWGNEGRIIGVVKDFHYKHMVEEIQPILLRIIDSDRLGYIIVKINPVEIKNTISALKQIWDKFVPGYPFEYGFVDEDFDNLYRNENRFSLIFGYFTALAVIISSLGIFGLISFLAEKRKKEIGIRKVLGASVESIIYVLSKEFIILVFISMIISIPFAYYFMDKWLTNYAYHISMNIITFAAAGFIAIIITLLTISYKSIRAATANPVESIKYE